jgi:hypothetical protein
MKNEKHNLIIPKYILGLWHISQESLKKTAASNGLSDEELNFAWGVLAAAEKASEENNVSLEDNSELDEGLKALVEIATMTLTIYPAEIRMKYGSEKCIYNIIAAEIHGDEIRIKGNEDDGSKTDFVCTGDQVSVRSSDMEYAWIFVRNEFRFE